MKQPSLGGRLATLTRWVVSLSLIALILGGIDVGEVLTVLRSADLAWLAVAWAITVADRFFMAGKWLPLLRIHLPQAGIAQVVRAYFAASFAGLILPASVGGDALRAVGLGRHRQAVVEVGASILIERVLGLVASGIVALLVLCLAWMTPAPMGFLMPWALVAVMVGVIAAVLPLSKKARKTCGQLLEGVNSRKWASHLKRFGAAYGSYRHRPWTLVAVGTLSVFEQFVPVFAYWAISVALHIDLSPEALFIAVPLTIFAARLPLSIAGIGILEGGLVYLLGLFGVAGSEALSLALGARAVDLLALLPGAFWWRELTGGNTAESAAVVPYSEFDSNDWS